MTGRRAEGPRGRVLGVTLPELLVVLVILGLTSGVGVLSLVSLRPTATSVKLDSLRTARAKAIRSGKAGVIQVDSLLVRFLPDGRVLGGRLDPITGEWKSNAQ